MNQCETLLALHEIRRDWQKKNQRVALVPTMGNLHAGHCSLIEKAKQFADKVVVSIFVNPLQFGPNEDFGRYPRTLEEDYSKCQLLGVDAVFAPPMGEVHPVLKEYVQVSVPSISDELCGKSRPGFFYGISTVVAKLFNLVQPHMAIFGEKDYQQVCVIQRMIQELHYPIELIVGETIREQDGLAMSSRNQYLSPEERVRAPELYRTLELLKKQIELGDKRVTEASRAAFDRLGEQGFKMDYLVARSLQKFEAITEPTEPFKLLLACWLGQTRLIDNITVGTL